MLTGIGDAENLAWKLALVIRCGAHEPLIDTYQAERRPLATEVLRGTSAVTRVNVASNPVGRFVRDRIILPLFSLPWIQRRATYAASQLWVSYRKGPLGGRGGRQRSGDRIGDLDCVRDEGRPSRLQRWPTKEELIAQAIETLVARDVEWPTDEEIERGSPYRLVEAALPDAAETAAAPEFRALAARILGSSVSHPSLMATYWQHYVLPRRKLTARLLQRAQQDGTVAADADLDVLIDMMAGAVVYRVLQPDPPDAEEMRVYLRAVYRQVGLLP
jgi:Tetracyclin repressor-like, C-terminal domain/FAD binding domain